MQLANYCNIKEIHEKTGHYIRLAGKSSAPISITDRGKVVAVISSPDLITLRPRVRKHTKEFLEYFAATAPVSQKNKKRTGSLTKKQKSILVKEDAIQEDLDAIRGEI